VPSEKFGKFLSAIFDEWITRDVGTVYVTTFDIALGSWLGQHNACIIAPTCGGALVMEHNGDVYSCDHFVEPDHRLGNVKETPLRTLITSEKQRRFGQNKYDTLPKYCKECPVLFACYGECPRNRFIKTPDGEEGLNYLCAGYKAFFTHIDGPMKMMAGLLRQGRFADEIMQLPAKPPAGGEEKNSMKEIILLTLKIAAPISVALIMFAQGLAIDPKQVAGYFKERPWLVVRSLVAALVLVPAAALAVILVLKPAIGPAVGLAILMSCPPAPLMLRSAPKKGASAAFMATLHLSLAALAFVSVPAVLYVLSRQLGFDADVDLAAMAVVLSRTILGPLGLGLAVHAFAPSFASAAPF
jgi:radical SAM protein with 4Fe4S-binding SPASM domain